MKHFMLACAVLGALTLTGCNLDDFLSGGKSQTETVSGTGTIVYVDLEGGFYGLVADNGIRFLPLNLAQAFEQNGLSVSFTATIADDTLTIQQWGTPINVLEISVR